MSLTNNNPVCVIQVNDSLHIYVVASTSTEFVLGLNKYDYMHLRSLQRRRRALLTRSTVTDLVSCNDFGDCGHIRCPSYQIHQVGWEEESTETITLLVTRVIGPQASSNIANPTRESTASSFTIYDPVVINQADVMNEIAMTAH